MKDDVFITRLLQIAADLETNVEIKGVPTDGPPVIERDGEMLVRIFYWAIEGFPLLFPNDFEMVNGDVTLTNSKTKCLVHDIVDYLDMEPAEFMHCFVPTMQQPAIYGGKILTIRATPFDIAANIRSLVSTKLSVNVRIEKRKMLN